MIVDFINVCFSVTMQNKPNSTSGPPVRGLTNVDQLKNTYPYNISKYGGIKYPIKSLYEPV